MQPALLALILWGGSKLLLGGPLVLMHWSQQRLRSVPAPLFRRREPVPGRTRLREAGVGLVVCYALCAATHYFSIRAQAGTSLTLNPVAGGPAERAGLLRGDRARSVNGSPVSTFEEFRDDVIETPHPVSIEVEREGRLVRLHVRKNEQNLIGVIPEPGAPLGVGAAFSIAVVKPAIVIADWLSALGPLILGEKVALSGATEVRMLASAGRAAFLHIFALLVTLDLLAISLIHTVVLVADTRSRRRYQATLPSSTTS